MADEVKGKSFWDKPEGTWGMVFPVLLVVAAVFFKSALLAGITSMFMILGGAFAYGILALIAIVIIDGLFISGWLMLRYQVFCKNLRKAVIDESPLTVLAILKDRAKEKMKKIRGGKDEVKGRVNDCSNSLVTSKKEFVDFQKLAKQMKDDPDLQKLFRSNCGKMAIAADLVKETSEQLAEMTKHYNILNEAYTDLEAMLSEMDYKEIALKRKFQNAGALDKVWGLMRGIVKGESEDDAMHEEAIASINEQFAARMGRVESAMDDCKGKFDEIKVKREISENEGVDMFNQLSNISVDALAAPQRVSYTPVQPFTVNAGSSSYADMIKR